MQQETNLVGLEKILRTMERARPLMHLRKIFEYIGPSDKDMFTQYLQRTATELVNVLDDQNKKRKFLNGFTLGKLSTGLDTQLSAQRLGDYLFNELRDLSSLGKIRYFHIPFLMEFAYTRVLAHFSGETKEYQRAYTNLDANLPLLGPNCADFFQSIKSQNGKGLSRSQYDRLFAFLSYLVFSEIDTPINFFSAYQRFEEAMAFCKTVPEKYLNIMPIKRTKFRNSWRRYKRYVKDKHSEYYQWITRLQEFEKGHPALHRTMQAYVLNKDRINNTERFAVEYSQ